MPQSNAFKFANNILTNGGYDAADLVGAAGGSFTFLGETTASNVATVDLNGYFTSDYDVAHHVRCFSETSQQEYCFIPRSLRFSKGRSPSIPAPKNTPQP